MDAEITIPASMSDARSLRLTGSAGLSPAMVLWVAILHVGLIAALTLLFRAAPLPSPPDIGTPVVFIPAPPSAAAPPSVDVAATTLQQPDAPQPVSLAPVPQLVLPAGEQAFVQARPVRATHRLKPPAAPAPLTHDVTDPPPPLQGPVAPAQVERPAMRSAAAADMNPRVMTAWEARIRQAVQDAAVYPASARLLHRNGRAEVRFEYDRGTIELASIAESSHVDALDSAALAAVTRAAIPDPPAELGPQKRIMQVWVQFNLSEE